ncbi:phospholipase A2 inhibitor NAI-like [Pelodytes ibericus]
MSHTVTSAMGAKASEQVFRNCVPSKYCSLEGSMSIFGKVRSQVGYSCCSTDNCKPTQPQFRAIDTNPNGLVCRSCLAADSEWCYTDETITCTGSENMCLLQTTKIRGPVTATTAFRGCATKSICEIGSQSATHESVSVDSKFICTNGAGGLYSGFLLSLVVSVFLTKFLS